MTEALEVVRACNPTLALVAVVLLGYRVGLRWWTQPSHAERQVRLVFLGYVIAAGLGAAQATALGSPVGPVTVLMTCLHVSLITLMVRWRPGTKEK